MKAGLYRVYYTVEGGETPGFFAIEAESEADALAEGKRLVKKHYGDDGEVTGAKWLRDPILTFVHVTW